MYFLGYSTIKVRQNSKDTLWFSIWSNIVANTEALCIKKALKTGYYLVETFTAFTPIFFLWQKSVLLEHIPQIFIQTVLSCDST